jgi:trimethylamine--corrinoid protein Co-methyltransferase
MQTVEVLACNVMNHALLEPHVRLRRRPTILDMKTMMAASAPEAALLFLATVELQKYYGNADPVFPYALSTDSKFPDIQAGVDKSVTALLAILSGSRLLSAGMGCLALAGTASLAQIVIDYELCKSLEQIARGFVVDADHIGLDLIKRVGIGGSFLSEEHTVGHMRETLWFPKLFDRSAADGWCLDQHGMLARAKAQVHQILSNDKEPTYLRGEQVAELERIAAHARRFS